MPLYQYQCLECRVTEERIAGIDDRTVTCTHCGALMTRTTADKDLLQAYVEKEEGSSR